MSRSPLAHSIAAAAAVAVLLALPAPAFAEEGEDYSDEFGIVGGLALGDKNIAGDDQESRIGPAVGLRYGHMLGDHAALFTDGTFAAFKTAGLPEAQMSTLRLGFEWLFDPWEKWRWSVNAGAGWTGVHFSDTLTDFDRPIVSVGFGQRRHMDRRQFFRWEIRADQTLGDKVLDDQTLLTVYGLVGLTWGVGGPPRDTDGDGVPDRKDQCPDTPRGATVTERGCPLDTDGDGVFDGIDRCPDTPKGWAVDAKGCPLDTDGDGVADGADQCPNTPKGAKVDAKGCPMDTDGDGVFDGIDQCANTPKGVKVDSKGCPLDTDGDGVFDGVDQCPGTPKGTKVDAKGCPIVEEKPAPAPLFTATQREFVLEGVNFENNSAKLTTDATFVLDKVAETLKYYKDVNVQVGGHTDANGSDAYNQRLSEARAKSVMDYLASKGVAAARMTAKGFGEKQPIADNKVEEGRAKNRRVALTKTN